MVVAIRHTLFLVFSDLYRTSGPENNENKKHFSNNIGPKFSIHRQVSLSATPFPFLYVSSTENAKRNKDIIIFLTTYQKWENENVSCALCWSIHLLNDVLFKILEFSNILCLVYSQSIVFSCNPSTVL